MDTFWQDWRYGIRKLWQRPGFTAVAVLTLALGIGANTAIFSIVNAVLLRPLPFKDADRLVKVWEDYPQTGKTRVDAAVANFNDWRNDSQVFDGIAAYFTWNYNLTGVEEPERVAATVVSGDFFQTLGVHAQSGRVILPDDDTAGADNVVVLSHALWQRRFGADPALIGKAIILNNTNFTVIGVMPESFNFPGKDTDKNTDKDTELWVPAGFGQAQQQDREGKFLKVVARLKPDVDLRQAEAELNTIATRLEQSHPQTNSGWRVSLVALLDDSVQDVQPTLFILLGVTGLVLLIACANVANLLLSRATGRRNEFAIRAALGASRKRIVSLLLCESATLAIVGGGLGILLAMWGVEFLAALSPGNIPRLTESNLDLRVLAFTFGLTLLTVLLFGLFPAFTVSRPNLNEVLQQSSKGAIEGTSGGLRHLFATAQVAIALVLLIGAGLLLKSFLRLQAVDTGFSTEQLLTLRIWLPASKYPTDEQQTAFFQQTSERLQSLPGVQAVGAIQDLPLRRNNMTFAFEMEGQSPAQLSDKPRTGYRTVTANYFHTLQIPILVGRGFSDQDHRQAPPVVLINQSLAQRYFPGEDPIGKRLRLADDNRWTSIVGIVKDVKHMGLGEEEGAVLYQPHAQKLFPFLRWMTMVIKTENAPASLIPAVREQVLALDKDQPIADIETMEQVFSGSLAKPRFSTVLLILFAVLAVLLATVGIYGVVAYQVTRQRREIGIRIALGASSKQVMQMILRQGLKVALTGIACGIAGAYLLTRWLTSLLFEVQTTDLPVYALLSVFLLFVVLLACYIPARRATKVDPMVALRYE